MTPLLLLSAALAQDTQPLPPAPTRPRPEPAALPDEVPLFGSDFSVGYAPGALLGNWPVPGIHGALLGRYDAFLVPYTVPGPRLGLSLWASGALWPLQDRDEGGEIAPLRYLHYGAVSALRFDPAAPWSGTAGMGFGRLDLDDWWGGPQYLPTLTFEAGARRRLSERAFLDGMLRAHWSTARDPTGTGFEEWWLVQFAVSVGGHVR